MPVGGAGGSSCWSGPFDGLRDLGGAWPLAEGPGLGATGDLVGVAVGGASLSTPGGGAGRAQAWVPRPRACSVSRA